MFKALFAFKKTHPSSIGFDENEEFIGLPGASTDKNWYYVIDTNGTAGYVPKNYVEKNEVTLEYFKSMAEKIKERIKVSKIGNREKGELIAKVDRSRINYEKTLPQPAAFFTNVIVQQNQPPPQPPRPSSPNAQLQNNQGQSGSSDSRSSTPPKSMKKRAAPKPPAINQVKSTNSSRDSSPSNNSTATVNSKSTKSAAEDVNAIQTVSEHNRQQVKKQISKQSSSNPTTTSSTSTTTTACPTSATSTTTTASARRPSIPDPNEGQLRTHARELIELIRNQTGLSYDMSQETILSVLSYVSSNFSRLDRNIPALTCELERSSSELLKEPKEVATSADSKVLEKLFEELTRCKEDDQQRNWMLYEDEGRIAKLLNHVCDRLQNAHSSASLHVLRRFKYFYVTNLVEYFQMEVRWSLRKLLIEAFLLMCYMDAKIISLMLSSVLPLELVQDIYQTKDVERLRSDGLMLTVILSSGEGMPVHYYDQIGRTFVDYLLDYIEEPPSRHFEVEVCDVFIGVLLAYNLQFRDISSNTMIQTLSRRVNAKTFIEKILLLLNRDEDPTAIIEGEYTYGLDTDIELERDVHATQKIMMDIFKHRDCNKLFYTNDLYVLIDIIVRQLCDLSYEDPKRGIYVDMCELVLRHSNYDEHLHRFKDLEHCFLRILEEEESRDRKKINDICKEINAFSSLVV